MLPGAALGMPGAVPPQRGAAARARARPPASGAPVLTAYRVGLARFAFAALPPPAEHRAQADACLSPARQPSQRRARTILTLHGIASRNVRPHRIAAPSGHAPGARLRWRRQLRGVATQFPETHVAGQAPRRHRRGPSSPPGRNQEQTVAWGCDAISPRRALPPSPPCRSRRPSRPAAPPSPSTRTSAAPPGADRRMGSQPQTPPRARCGVEARSDEGEGLTNNHHPSRHHRPARRQVQGFLQSVTDSASATRRAPEPARHPGHAVCIMSDQLRRVGSGTVGRCMGFLQWASDSASASHRAPEPGWCHPAEDADSRQQRRAARSAIPLSGAPTASSLNCRRPLSCLIRQRPCNQEAKSFCRR